MTLHIFPKQCEKNAFSIISLYPVLLHKSIPSPPSFIMPSQKLSTLDFTGLLFSLPCFLLTFRDYTHNTPPNLPKNFKNVWGCNTAGSTVLLRRQFPCLLPGNKRYSLVYMTAVKYIPEHLYWLPPDSQASGNKHVN